MSLIQWVPNHPPEDCQGTHCTKHNPSDHSMKSWDLHWCGDIAIYERICPRHGTGHPDPDCINHLVRTQGQEGYVKAIHGCCMCPECVQAFKE